MRHQTSYRHFDIRMEKWGPHMKHQTRYHFGASPPWAYIKTYGPELGMIMEWI